MQQDLHLNFVPAVAWSTFQPAKNIKRSRLTPRSFLLPNIMIQQKFVYYAIAINFYITIIYKKCYNNLLLSIIRGDPFAQLLNYC